MAGHSHWAGIKHKKGRQDKIRSKIFSKISREITVAAKLGSKDPNSNHRLRAAIETAKDANMPKDNINRAINKSDIDKIFNKGIKTLFNYKHKRKEKRGNILQNNEDIDFSLKDIIKNNDYLMIKGSNATGLNQFSKKMIKGI